MAAHGGYSTWTNLPSVDFTDGATTTTAAYHTKVVQNAPDAQWQTATVGISDPSGVFTADTIHINSRADGTGLDSSLAGLIITDKPVVSVDPVGGTILADSTLSLTAGAIGLPTLIYQWYQGTTAVGTDSPTYTKTNATSEDSGDYTVVVTNAYGEATSAVATVTVTVPATVTWDADTVTDGAQDGSGTWDATTANWWDGASNIVWSNLNYATFGAGGTGSATVTLADDAAVSSLTFSDVEYTLSTTTGKTLTAPLITSHSNAAIALALTGSGGMTKDGTGTLTLSGQSSYIGGTFVNEGKLVLLNTGNDGVTRISGALTVNSGGTVETNNGDSTGLGWQGQVTSVAINGGTINYTTMGHIWGIAGGITMTGGILQSNNGVNLAGNTGDGLQLEWNKTNVTTLASSQTATIAGRIRIRNDGGETGIVFNVADGDAATDLLVSAGIGQYSGNMGITKNGAGLMALTGTNTYGGDTTVNQGTLWVSGRLTGNGALTLKDDTALTVIAGGATPAITTTGDMNVGSTLGSPTGTNTINIAGLTSTSVAPMSAGALYFDNPVTINILYVAPTVGQYPLIHASGGATIYGLTLGTLPYGISADLVNDTAGPTQSIYLDVTSVVIPSNLWTGATNGNWDINTTQNWTESGSPAYYLDGNFATFDDTASVTDVTLDTTVNPTGVTFNNPGKNYTLSGSGSIAGYTGLLKQGLGTLTLATPNTYTGGTVLDAGALHINHAQAIGNGSLTINGGTLDNTSAAAITVTNTIPQAWNADVTFAGTDDLVFSAGTVTLGANRIVTVANGLLGIGGALNAATDVTLTKAGAGTLSVGSGNWNGLTTVTGGTLEVNGKTNDVAYVVSSGATLKIGYSTGGGYANTNLKLTGDGVAATTGLYLKGGITYNGSGNIELLAAPTTIRQYGSGLASIGIFDIGGNAITTVEASSGSVIDANIQMVDYGYGMSVNVAVGAATANGDLVINGPLSVGTLGFYKRGAGSLLLNGVATTDNLYVRVHGGSVICGIDNCLGTNAKLDISSGNKLVLNGYNQTTSSLLANTGSIVGGSATTATLTLGQADAVTFAGIIGGTGTNENNLALTKAGASTLALSGTNTYSGGTTVNQGSLAVTGLLTGGGPLTVANGATLQVTAGGSNAAVVASTVTLGSGAALSLDFTNLTSTSVSVISASDVQVNSPVTVNIASVTMAAGQYPLFKFTGPKSGSGTFTQGTLPSYVVATLVDDTAGPSKSVYLDVTGVIQLFWTGATNGAWDLTTTNWKDAVNAPATYVNGAIARFDDSASVTDITLDTSLSTAEMIFTNTAKNYSLSGTGTLSCNVGLVKSGAGALTLLNDNTANTGTVLITGGMVTVGDGGTLGTLGGTGNITLDTGATLAFNRSDAQTLDRTMVGTGGMFIKDGSNTLTMNAANNTCDIVINNGTLAARSGGWSTSFAASRTITVNAPGILDTTTHALGGLGGATRPNNIVLNEDAVWKLNNEQQLPNTALTLTAGILNGPGEIRGGGTITTVAHASKSSVINCGINNGNGAATFNVANGDVDADLLVTGVISSGNGFTKTGDGKMVLSGVNTYTGNTTVAAGTLELGSTGGLKFVVTNSTNNKITGAGTATLDGSFTIDTSAVTVAIGSWALVDVATKTYGGTFDVPGFTVSSGVWTKVVEPSTWSFDETTGVLSVTAPALITSFGIPGYDGVINQSAKTIALSVPGNTNLATLAPTYTLSSGNCNQPNDGTTPPTPTFASGPVTYTVTDGATVNGYVVTVTLTNGLNVSTYLGVTGSGNLAPISNLMALTPTATGIQSANIDYHGATFATLPGAPGPDNFSVLWEGWFDVLAAGGYGAYTFGTSSDDGSVIYMDLNRNGSFADAGEYIVNNNRDQGNTQATGTVTLNQHSVHLVIGYYQGGGGYDMSAGFAKGAGLAWNLLSLINGTSGYFLSYDPPPPPAEIMSFGIPGSVGVIDQSTHTIALTVPWAPWGTALETLNPTFTLSSGTCNQTSGSPPSPSFAVQNPATYTVTDGATVNNYTVTVTVTPISTAKVMSKVYFPGYGYAWASDGTGYNWLMVVPSSTNLTALAPTFSVSQFATSSPASGTARNFTTPQTYTVTAQDGSTQDYMITVQKITATGTGSYQQKVLASGPVSYWPLNETSGTTAFDLASGLNNATYGGTLTLNQTGLRADGNPSVLFTAAAADPNNTRAAYSNSLNPNYAFTVECWVKPNDAVVQYLVSLQDRVNYGGGAGRIGYALWKNNPTGFGMQWGTGATTTGSINGTTPTVPGTAYYVVATYDGTTMRLYVNGNLENSLAAPVYVPAGASQPGFTIGSRNGSTAAPSNIQDVALYTRALTQAEIQNHYLSTISYATWAATYAGGQTPGEDYNNDGVQNGIAFFMGATGIATNPGLNAGNTVTWPVSASFSGSYEVQTSPDLDTWTNVTPKPLPAGGNLSYTLPPGAGKQFVRLVVTPN